MDPSPEINLFIKSFEFSPSFCTIPTFRRRKTFVFALIFLQIGQKKSTKMNKFIPGDPLFREFKII